MGKRGGVRSTAWKPGQSGNPSGKPKGYNTQLKELLSPYVETAVQQLVELLTVEKLEPKLRLEVVREVLDRVFGKPTTMVDTSAETAELMGIVSAEMYANRMGAAVRTSDESIPKCPNS